VHGSDCSSTRGQKEEVAAGARATLPWNTHCFWLWSLAPAHRLHHHNIQKEYLA
jgi:hypothetical protein